MAEITASMVKDLREKTGAGMMDCKQALAENRGELEAAVDWLRKKGLAKAAKKAGRTAAEGLVAVATAGSRGALVEVNAETDFVARNEKFQAMVREIGALALAADGDLDKLKAAKFPGSGKTVGEHVSEMIATIGENLSVRRAAGLKVGTGVVASYVHNQAASGLGKIGVLVGLESTGNAEKLAALGRQLAMHVAAANPIALTADRIEPAVVERERGVLAEKARESGKPDEIVARIVESGLKKFHEEVALLSQVFVIDGKTPVEKAVKAAEREAGAPIRVTGFVRFALGEGIDKGPGPENFAAEVAKSMTLG